MFYNTMKNYHKLVEFLLSSQHFFTVEKRSKNGFTSFFTPQKTNNRLSIHPKLI